RAWPQPRPVAGRHPRIDRRRQSLAVRQPHHPDRLAEDEADCGVGLRHPAGGRARAGAARIGRRPRRGARIAPTGAHPRHRGAVRARNGTRRCGARPVAGGRHERSATRAHRATAGGEALLPAPPGHGGRNPRVVPITAVPGVVRETVFEWRNTRIADLLFAHRDAAVMTLVLLVGIALALLILRAATRRKAGRTQVALPAGLNWSRPSWVSIVRHGTLLLFLAGLPFFVIALADPYTTFTRQDVSYPGRRIAVMIDASSSMMARFPAANLNKNAPNEATFFTAVAAAEAFMRQRISGKYHDLIGLIEFGDEAYVVTPFTTDYENILLSMSLIGDWTEFMKFPDQGTTIAAAIEQGTGL